MFLSVCVSLYLNEFDLMLRARSPFLLAKVPFSHLFEYNHVLHRVFSTPQKKVALTLELPHSPQVAITYGELQRDVVAMADTLVQRREAVANARGEAPLTWVQPSRPKNVRSLFAQGERVASCDHVKDTGFYTTALLGGPGYVYVVSLLANWAVNQLVTPMSVSQRYNDELMYVLEHSGSRMIVGETALLREKIPDYYGDVTVRNLSEISSVSAVAKCGASSAADPKSTYHVDTVMDASMILAELNSRHASGHIDASEVESLKPQGIADAGIHTAEDVVRRLNHERQSVKDQEHHRQEERLKAEHKKRYQSPEVDDASDVAYFDTEQVSALNPVFRRWYENPDSRPTRYDDCLMIYTSGTTARPKGAVHTHASVGNMVKVLQDAWEWTAEDAILHVLPVHHIHGLVNVLLCSLASGARCVFTKFDDPSRIAHRLERGDISLFMAVPTIYTKMIAAVQKKFSAIERTGFHKACLEHVRLMVSGSAALPVPTLEQFRQLSGHTLLERYGMTEIGMALSQPLRPVSKRIPGTVGVALPTVAVYVHQPETEEAQSQAKAKEQQYQEVGSLSIASESLFDRYWNNPQATKKELRTDASGHRYFDTGDTVGVFHYPGNEAPVYTILGRSSVDIIKSRGYKLSALEIEAALLSRKDLFYEMAVVGIPDPVNGEAVVAVIAMQPEATSQRGIAVPADGSAYEAPELTAELKEVALKVLAPYKCPARYLIVREIPRNATGKVNKKNLKKALKLS